MVVLYFLLLLVTDLVGLVLAAFTLPGLWLMVAGAAVYAWLTDGYLLGWKTLIALLLLALIAEIAEIFLGGAGAKKAGASGWGMTGGLIGGVIGGICLTTLIPIFILGTIIGICLGCFLGAFAVELLMGQPLTQSAKIGLGAATGKLTGIAGKVIIGLLMILITFISGFPRHHKAMAHSPAQSVTMPATTRAVK
jgi:uncharacterized protein YqgC (DUF456 family)